MTVVGSTPWLIATARAMHEATAGLSHDEIRSALQDALGSVGRDGDGWPPFVREVFDAEVIYEWDGKLWRAGYSIDEAKAVELGDARQVRVSYVDVGEVDPAEAAEALDFGDKATREALVRRARDDHGFRAEIRSLLDKLEEAEPIALVDLVESEPASTLREGAVADDGTATLKLIGPGWGSSGYYSEAVLRRDGAAAFPKGTKDFWNHPTRTEERERPEGDLDLLASELVEDARYEAQGPEGPGLYARAKVFGPYRERVNELAPHIGMSIRAEGRVAPGTAEGRTGPIVQTLERGISVDYVTLPGAKGAIVEMFESAGRSARQIADKEGDDVDELKEAQERAEAAEREQREATERAERAETALAVAGAREAAAKVLGGQAYAKLPEATRSRVIEAVSLAAPMKDGKLDTEALDAKVKEAADAEVAYLKAAFGGTEVTGLGESQAEGGKDDEPVAEAQSDREKELLGRIAGGVGTLSERGQEEFTKGRVVRG